MPETRKYTTGEARDQFADLVNQAAFGSERVVLTRHGKDIAALVPMSDLDLLRQLETLIDLDEARAAFKEAQGGDSISLNELKKIVGI
jgi:prevent-host-death family protein